MRMESVSLYTETRNEYLKQLSTWIIPPLVDFFRKEYNTISGRDAKKAMALFQEFCSEVPRWNQDVIDTHVGSLLDTCRCDYVEELMTAVFIAHTKMLTAIRVNSRQKKLQITLPKLDRFLHRVFVECARAFWKAPFLFSDELTPIEKQKNVLQAEAMCTEALSGAVRSLLPVKSILADYLNDDSSDEEVAPLKKKGKRAIVESDSDSESEDDQLDAPTIDPIVPEPVVLAPVVPEPVVMAPVVPEPVVLAPAAIIETPHNVIEKIETLPESVAPTVSLHSIMAKPKASSITIEKGSEVVESFEPQVTIDTEPSVHFTPYDTVYDETTAGISEIRYTPKISVEEKPPSSWGYDDEDEDAPRLTISNTSSEIGGDDIESIGATEIHDIDAPLDSTGDFEVLS